MRSFSLPWFARTGCVCWVGVKINVVLSGTTVISNTAYFSPRASSACSHKSAETHISTPRETDRFLLTDFLLQQGENVLQWSTLSACTALSCRAGSSRAFPIALPRSWTHWGCSRLQPTPAAAASIKTAPVRAGDVACWPDKGEQLRRSVADAQRYSTNFWHVQVLLLVLPFFSFVFLIRTPQSGKADARPIFSK